VNSKVLENFNITKVTPDPEGGQIMKDSDGNPTGILTDNARALVVLPPPTEMDKVTYLKAALKYIVRFGLTTVVDMGNDYSVIQIFKQLVDNGEVPIRISA